MKGIDASFYQLNGYTQCCLIPVTPGHVLPDCFLVVEPQSLLVCGDLALQKSYYNWELVSNSHRVPDQYVV